MERRWHIKKAKTPLIYIRILVGDGVLYSIFTHKNSHWSTTHIEYYRGSCVFSHAYSQDEGSNDTNDMSHGKAMSRLV